MKIILICGSLEFGKVGVGDYCRRLSIALYKRGIEVALIGYNDGYIDNPIHSLENFENGSFPILRFPRKFNESNKVDLAIKFISDFKPDWLSLQFVSYAFHEKGLPFSLVKSLKFLGKEIKWHFMFHELWIGMDKNAHIRERIIGFFQKKIIFNLIKSLKPLVINTHSQVYQFQLNSFALNSHILPLFGNIVPIKTNCDFDYGSYFNIVIFGSIYKDSKFLEFIKWLPLNSKFKFFFHFVGGNGKELNLFLDHLREFNFAYKVHGWKNDYYISNLLISSQLGLSTTPYNLTEKSGSVAAMLEHNLPVFSIGNDWLLKKSPKRIFLIENVIRWNKELSFNKLTLNSFSSNNVYFDKIVNDFIQSLIF